MKSLYRAGQTHGKKCEDEKDLWNVDEQKCMGWEEFSLPTLIKMARALGMDKELKQMKTWPNLKTEEQNITFRKRMLFNKIREMVGTKRDQKVRPIDPIFHELYMKALRREFGTEDVYMKKFAKREEDMNHVELLKYKLNMELFHHFGQTTYHGPKWSDKDKWYYQLIALLNAGANPNFIPLSDSSRANLITDFGRISAYFNEGRRLKLLDILDLAGADFLLQPFTFTYHFNNRDTSPAVVAKIFKLTLKRYNEVKNMSLYGSNNGLRDEAMRRFERAVVSFLLDEPSEKKKQVLNLLLKEPYDAYINAYLTFRKQNASMPKEIAKLIVAQSWYDAFCNKNYKLVNDKLVNLELVLLARMLNIQNAAHNFAIDNLCSRIQERLKEYGRQADVPWKTKDEPIVRSEKYIPIDDREMLKKREYDPLEEVVLEDVIESPADIIRKQNYAYEQSLQEDRRRDDKRMQVQTRKERLEKKKYDDRERVRAAEQRTEGSSMLRFSILLPQSEVVNVVFNENAPVSTLFSGVELSLPEVEDYRLISLPIRGISDVVIEADDDRTFKERGMKSMKLLFEETE